MASELVVVQLHTPADKIAPPPQKKIPNEQEHEWPPSGSGCFGGQKATLSLVGIRTPTRLLCSPKPSHYAGFLCLVVLIYHIGACVPNIITFLYGLFYEAEIISHYIGLA